MYWESSHHHLTNRTVDLRYHGYVCVLRLIVTIPRDDIIERNDIIVTVVELLGDYCIIPLVDFLIKQDKGRYPPAHRFPQDY